VSVGIELREEPRFLDEAECSHLVALIDRGRTPSQIVATDNPDPEFRTSETCWLSHSDPVVTALLHRIASLLGIDPAHGEAMQGQRYAPGQHFRPHHDYFDTTKPYWPREQRQGGQRGWTAMIFLNRPEAGGETRFPLAGLSFTPEPGLLLAWNNLDREGRPNPLTLHEGCAVEAGTKYIITQWFRERPCRKPGVVPAIKRSAFRLLTGLRARFRALSSPLRSVP
jgi:prolyl 4-hydroxylase